MLRIYQAFFYVDRPHLWFYRKDVMEKLQTIQEYIQYVCLFYIHHTQPSNTILTIFLKSLSLFKSGFYTGLVVKIGLPQKEGKK